MSVLNCPIRFVKVTGKKKRVLFLIVCVLCALCYLSSYHTGIVLFWTLCMIVYNIVHYIGKMNAFRFGVEIVLGNHADYLFGDLRLFRSWLESTMCHVLQKSVFPYLIRNSKDCMTSEIFYATFIFFLVTVYIPTSFSHNMTAYCTWSAWSV